MSKYEQWEQKMREASMRSGKHPAGRKLNGEQLAARHQRKESFGVKQYEPADIGVMETDKPLDYMISIFQDFLFDDHTNSFMQGIIALTRRRMSAERDELLHSGEFAKLPPEEQIFWRDPEHWDELELFSVLMDKCIEDVLMTYIMRRTKEEFWG